MTTIINRATYISDTFYSMYDSYFILPGGSLVFLGMDSYYDPMYYYPYQEVYIGGEITASFIQNADAIVGDCALMYLYLSSADISFNNANINLNDNHQYTSHYHDYGYYAPTRLELYSSSLEMEGGSLSVTSMMYGDDRISASNSTVNLIGTEVTCRNIYMSYSDVFLNGVTFRNVDNVDIYRGEFVAVDTIFSSAVYLSEGVEWNGSNNYFTSRNTISCYVTSEADLEKVFTFVAGSSAENPYVSIRVCSGADFTYSDSLVPDENEGFSIRISAVDSNSTVTIAEGSSLHSCCDMSCYVYGTLKAEFDAVADAIVSSEVGYEDYYISNGGVLDFTRANINLNHSYSALSVMNGGVLRVTEAGIKAGYGFTVNDGATIEITDCNIGGKLKLMDGSKGTIKDSVIENLSLSLVSDVEIKGCDLSSTIFELTDLSAGSMVDLSGNYWGTNDREVIEKRLGEYASLVYLGELEGEYTGTRTYTVTTTADSGVGSLRWAIEQANAYEGTERTEIVFDELLAGSTIELLSDLTVSARTSMVNFTENPVRVTGAALVTSAELILQNMVLEQLIVNGGVPVIGSGNVLTGTGDALRIDHMSAYLGLLEVSMLEQNANIGLGSMVSDGMMRANHLGLEYHVTGNSVLAGTVTVDVGETLVLDSGSVLDWTYYNRDENNSTYYVRLYVDGTLKGEGATLGGDEAGYLYVRNGAIVDLKDTDVIFRSNSNTNLVLNGNCKFKMEGGVLDAKLYTLWGTNKDAEILLRDVEINKNVDVYYGQYCFDGCVINSPIDFSYVSSSTSVSVDIRNCVFNVGLAGIEYSDLAYIKGSNNSFASDMIADMNIYAWGTSSNIDFEKLNLLVGSVESVSPYINISGSTNTETKLIAFDACERIEYRVKDPTSNQSYPYFCIEYSGVLNIEEGACLGISGGGQSIYYDPYMGYYPPEYISYFVDSDDDYYYYYNYENVYAGVMVNGQIKAEFASNADAIVTNEDRVRICVSGSNGCLSLKNANVRMTGQDNDLRVKYDGNVRIEGGTVEITDGLHVEEGGSAELSNLTLSADVYSAGGLTLTDSRVEKAITITGGSVVITGTTGLTELNILSSVDSVTLTDNDFSNTVFNIDGSVVVDLTGNYWGGLTDVAEIRSRYGLGSNVIVNSALEDSSNIQEFVFSVTNTADSGDGSLRQAVSKANAYTGSEVVRINISASLAGQEITLRSNLSLNNKCIITGPSQNPLVLKGGTLIVNSEVSLKNITLPTLRLTGSAVVDCEGVVCTAERAIELFGWSGEADFSGIRATHSSAYVGISGEIESDTTLCDLPTTFRGGYALYGATTVDEEAELTLADGVKCNMGAYQLRIYGKLSQNNSVATNGLYSSGKACNVVVADGGELSLVNSHFSSAGTSLNPLGSLTVESGGQLSFADSNLTVGTFTVAGSAEMDGGTLNSNTATVKNGGSFEGSSVLIEHSFTAESGSSLNMKDCVVAEYLTIKGAASLEKVSCARLVLGAGATITSTGVGVTMTEEEALRLDGWSGSTEDLLKSFTWNAIADGAYVGICGTIGGNSTFGILPTALRSGGYKLSGTTTIAASTTTTLEEGVIWHLNNRELRIDGTLSIENESYTQALVSDAAAGVVIGSEGKLELTNSGIAFRHSDGSAMGKLTVNGGELLVTDAVLTCADITVNSGKADLSGGTVDALNTEVSSGASLTALGTNFTASLTGAAGSELSLKNCSLADTLAVEGMAELSSVSCATLTLSADTELVIDAVGVTVTGQNAIVLKNWHGLVSDVLESFNWTATAERARLGIAGNIAANSTFCVLPNSLRGGYVLADNTTVLVGAAVELEDGVSWDIDGKSLFIKGTLSAANTTARNTLFNQDGDGNIYVHDGATLELEKAHISMTTADAQLAGMLYVYSGGELSMEESNVQAQVVHVYGTATHTDGRVNCHTYDVYSGGSLEFTDVTHNGNLSLRAGAVGTVNRVSITGNFAAKGKVSATDVSCATLIFGGDCDLTVTNSKITMSAREAIRLEDWHGNTAETLASFAWKAEAEDAYVGIGGQITGNSVFTALPVTLPGGYRLSSDVTIAAGAVVTLNEGISWHADGKTLRVYGELCAVNKTRTTAIDLNGGTVYVQANGKILLTRADIDFSAGSPTLSGAVNVVSGGLLSLNDSEMRVKTLTLAGSLALAENASLCVSALRVNRNSTISAVDSRIEGDVYANNATTISFIRSEISGILQAAPGAHLESFTCQSLELSTLTDLTVAGTGVTLTGAQALRLNSVCGGVSEALQLYKWNCTDENAYVGLLGSLSADTTYSALPENRFVGGYKLVDQLTVGSGVTMSIGAGSRWNLNGRWLTVRGAVEINGDEDATVELGSGSIALVKGAVLTAENVNSRASVTVAEGAELSLTNTTLTGVSLAADSMANLSGCVLTGKSTISLVADATISGNDLSKATIVLADTDERGVVDLSGNYWGTLDLREITSRIQNYSEERVLISSILTSPPTQEFCFDAVMFGHHRLSDKATSLVLTFNRSVDADSVTAESLGLFDAEGRAVTGVSYEVNGNKVMLHFSPLAIGKYTVKATDKLLDVEGHSFSQSDNFANGIEYNCMEIGAPRVLLFRSNSTVTDVFSYVDLFFDQDMDSATISTESVHLIGPDGKQVEFTHSLMAGMAGNIFYRFYFEPVTAKGTYRVQVDSSVCNDLGVAMDGGYAREVYVAAPDLMVQPDISYTDNALGRYTTITYSVTNAGDAMTPGTWTDSIYLCKTETWDADNAVLFGRVNRTTALADGESYTAQVRSLLDKLDFGSYYIFVKTDDSGRLSEADEANNINATGKLINIIPQELRKGTAHQRLQSANEVLYYEFTAAEDGSLSFSLDCANAQIFICEKGSGIPSQKNSIAAVFGDDEKTTAYFAVESGTTYYISATPRTSGTIQTDLEEVQFSLVGTSLDFITPGRAATITITGAGFKEGMTLWMQTVDGSLLNAQNVQIVDSCNAVAVFEVDENTALGTQFWLMAANVDGSTTSLSTPISVNSFAGAVDVEFLNDRESQRVGFYWSTDIQVSNNLGYDVETPIVLLTNSSGDDFYMYYDYEERRYINRTALMLLPGSNDRSRDIIAAGESTVLRAYMYKNTAGNGYTKAKVLSPDDESFVTADMWESIKSALKPTDVTEVEWAVWWNDMKPRIGDTVGDVANFIYDMQALALSTPGASPQTLPDIVACIIREHKDYAPKRSISGFVNDTEGNACQNVQIHVYEGDNLVASTVTDDLGYYLINTLQPNTTYTLVSSQLLEHETLYKDRIDFEVKDADVEMSLTVVNETVLNRIEQGARMTTDVAGKIARTIVINGTLYFVTEVDGVLREYIIAEGKELENIDLFWSEVHDAYVLSWLATEDERSAVAFCLVKADDNGVMCSETEQITADELSEYYFSDDSIDVITKTSTNSGTSYVYTEVFNSVESWSPITSTDTAFFYTGGFDGELERKLEFTVPFINYKVGYSEAYGRPEKFNNGLSGKATVSIKLGLGYDKDLKTAETKRLMAQLNKANVIGETYLKSSKRKDWSVEGDIAWEVEATAHANCATKTVHSSSEFTKMSGSLTISNEYGCLYILDGFGATSLRKTIEKFLDRLKTKYKDAFESKAPASLTLSFEKVNQQLKVSVSISAGVEAGLKSNSLITFGGGVKFDLSFGVDGIFNWDKGFTCDAAGWGELKLGAEIQVGKILFSGSAAGKLEFSTNEGFTPSFTIDAGISFKGTEDKKKALVSSNEAIGTILLPDVTDSDVSHHSEVLDAYTYIDEANRVYIQYVNAETKTPYGAENLLRNEGGLFSDGRFLSRLVTSSDRNGTLYVTAMGCVEAETDEYEKHTLDIVSVNTDGQQTDIDESALRSVWVNGQLCDTIDDVWEVDTCYLGDKLAMVWISRIDGVWMVFSSVLEEDAWQTPELIYSGRRQLRGSELRTVDDKFYIAFEQILLGESDVDVVESTSFLFLQDGDGWAFDADLNTEMATEFYQKYNAVQQAPEIHLGEPHITRVANGRIQVDFSITGSNIEELVLVIDGEEIELEDLQECSMTLYDGSHEYYLKAYNGVGQEVCSDKVAISYDATDPVVDTLLTDFIVRSDGQTKLRVRHTVEVGVVYSILVNGLAATQVEPGIWEIDAAPGASEIQLLATDASGNTYEYEYGVSYDSSAPLTTIEGIGFTAVAETGKTRTTLSWVQYEQSYYELFVDGKCVYSGTGSSYSVDLAEGEHIYTLWVSDGKGSGKTRVTGRFRTDITPPELSVEVSSQQRISDNESLVSMQWNADEYATYKLYVGEELVYEGADNNYSFVMTDGEHKVRLVAEDRYGNIAESGCSVHCDTTAPDLALALPYTILSEDDGYVTDFKWNATDESETTYCLVVNGKQVYEGADNQYRYVSATQVSGWRVTATDKWGNTTTVEDTTHYNTPMFRMLRSDYSVDDDGMLRGILEWSDAGVDEYVVLVNNEYYTTCQSTSLELELPAISGYSVDVIATNADMHQYSVSALLGDAEAIDSDQLTSGISIIMEDVKAVAHHGFGIEFQWERKPDVYYYISINGGAMVPVTRYGVSTLWGDVSRCIIPIAEDGKYQYTIQGVSKDKSVEYLSTGSIVLDSTPPEIALDWSSKSGLIWDTCTFEWTANEACEYRLIIDGDTEYKGTDLTAYEWLRSGEHTVELVAKDRYGNISTLKDVIYVGAEEAEETSFDFADLFFFWKRVQNNAKSMISFKECPEGCPSNPPPGEKCQETDVIIPVDPNEIYGPAAYGESQWIAPQEMEFRIACENLPAENIAHAAIVTITHKIDSAYDYSTFRLGNMMIANNLIEIKTDVTSYKARLDWTDTLGIWADVNVFFDADIGEVTWEFTAIDPATGTIMSDPFKGLLAPNFNPPEGDGMVYYYIQPKSTTKTGTTASSQASIVFDYNEPILTPVITYTFDADAPVATVQALAAESDSRYIMVNWSGSDKGSGLAGYNVYVSIDGEPWTLWQESITATGALYAVAEGEHTYAFFAQGLDYAGNAETVTELVIGEAATKSNYTSRSTELSVSSLSATREGDILTLQLVFNQVAECADWAAAVQLLAPSGSIDLSKGLFSYDSATNILTWQGDVSGIADGETLNVRMNSGIVTDAEGLPLGGDFTPSFSLPVTSSAAGASYAAPCLTDYNNDGLLDLLVGENSNGVGKVRLYLNEGTAEVAQFSTFTYLTTVDDTTLAVTAEGCQGAIVRMADLTGDGVADLLVGLADGTVRMYTAAEGGKWQDAGLLSCTVGGVEQVLSVNARAAIEVCDFNADGRTDLLVGTGTGNIVLYLDTAAEGAAVFDGGQFLHDCDGSIRAASRASVTVADVDGDGLTDLLVGASDGIIRFYRNEGSNSFPLFGKPINIQSGDSQLDFSGETSRVRISAADVDGDGFVDLMVGMADGSIRVLHGVNNSTPVGTVHAGDNPIYRVENINALVQGGGILISWDAVDGEDVSYEVSYCVSGQPESVIVEAVGTSATLQLPDGNYELRVRAITQGGTGPWSEFTTATIDTVAPVVPGSPQTAVGENGIAVLSWSATDSVSSYVVRYKSVAASTWQTVSTESTTVSLSNLPGGDIVWQVCSIDAAGNTSVWSDERIFTSTGTIPTLTTHWAEGMLFDADGNIIGGYADANKTGGGDSSLCWAAAASNILAWWQQQYPTGSVLNGVPQSADDIYTLFCNSWENVAGSEQYAFNWWLAGEVGSSSYKRFYTAYYCGNDDDGGWYSDYYNASNIGKHTAQVSLQSVDASDISKSWTGIYNAGGMLALGVFRSISGSSLTGGHSLTLWGFSENEDGLIEQIYVTDSDDEQNSILTLNVEVDADSKLYRISEGQDGLSGYYVGSYTYLKAGGMSPDGSTTEQAESLGLSSANDGSGQYSSSVLNWVGTGDSVDYYSIATTGDGSYRLNINTATLETAVRVSVGALNAQGEFEVKEELLLAPGAALGSLPGVVAGAGEKLYVKVEALVPENGGFYELSVDGTVPIAGTGLVTQNNSSAAATESAADGEIHRGWVGAGDVCDFYRVQMTSEGSLSFALSELESSARLRIYSERADGSLAQLDSRLVKSGSALEHTLSLTDGTYYIEIASADGGLGACNTSYSLTLQKEETDADNRDKSDIAVV